MHKKILPLIALGMLIPALALAWTGPTQSPPDGNVAAPINTGASGQTKSGDFAILGNVGIGTPTPGQKLHVVGNVYATGAVYSGEWVRINGGGGIYWQDYGGGWQMYDTTWIRAYNGKRVYMPGGFDTGDQAGVACGGGLGGGYTFRVCGSQIVTNHIVTPTLCLNGACRSSWGFTVLGGHYLVWVNNGYGGWQYCPGSGVVVGLVYDYMQGWWGGINYFICRDIY